MGIPQSYIRTIIVFSCMIAVSLLGAWIGCVIAGFRGQRRRISQVKNNTGGDVFSTFVNHTPFPSGVENSSERDVEMLAQLDAIMANETFTAREWGAYRRERRVKSRRRARRSMRTSQGIVLPTNVRRLRRGIGSLSRSPAHSTVESEGAQDSSVDGVQLNHTSQGFEDVDTETRELARTVQLDSERGIQTDRYYLSSTR